MKTRFFPAGMLIAAALALGGCPAHPPVMPEEPPLQPAVRSGPSTGQQQASIDLTDRGRQLLESGRWEEAISVFQKAISLSPSNPYPYYYLAKARYFRREYAQALPLLGQAERYLGADPAWLSRVYALRGRTYEALSRRDEAENQYRRALEKDPDNPEAREGIGRVGIRSH